jgi:hypothetical protein
VVFRVELGRGFRNSVFGLNYLFFVWLVCIVSFYWGAMCLHVLLCVWWVVVVSTDIMQHKTRDASPGNDLQTWTQRETQMCAA